MLLSPLQNPGSVRFHAVTGLGTALQEGRVQTTERRGPGYAGEAPSLLMGYLVILSFHVNMPLVASTGPVLAHNGMFMWLMP